MAPQSTTRQYFYKIFWTQPFIPALNPMRNGRNQTGYATTFREHSWPMYYGDPPLGHGAAEKTVGLVVSFLRAFPSFFLFFRAQPCRRFCRFFLSHPCVTHHTVGRLRRQCRAVGDGWLFRRYMQRRSHVRRPCECRSTSEEGED